jgi:hypothetical protein
MNQLKYRLNADIQAELAKLTKHLRHQTQDNPKRGFGYADAPKTWDAFKAQCKPVEFVRK